MRRTICTLLALFGLAAGLVLLPASPAAAEEVVYRRLAFPVDGSIRYSNDWGNARSGGRTHQGTDLMGTKLTPLVAVVDGTVRMARPENGGNSGNMLTIQDAEGWQYWYLHVNNDTPGTDDGANPEAFRFASGMAPGSPVKAGQVVAFLGDSGNAEGTAPHLHFELHTPDGTAVNPYYSLMLSQGRRVGDRCAFDDNPARRPSVDAGAGYWTLGRDGGVFSFGDARFHGSMGGRRLASPVIAMTPTAGGRGYWLLAGDGGVFSFGDARFAGSTGALRLNKPVVGMARTPSGNGYWLVASDGGIFTFGDARFFGSAGALRLSSPVVGMAPTPTGQGYWLVAADGGVFSFGDAGFHGSAGGRAPAPVVSMAVSPSGQGYWLQTANGLVLPYGDAAWAGDVGRVGYCSLPAAVDLVPTATGAGYWIQGADGTVWAFGDAIDRGSVRTQGVRTAGVVDLAPTR
jgi:hypothetical protein